MSENFLNVPQVGTTLEQMLANECILHPGTESLSNSKQSLKKNVCPRAEGRALRGISNESGAAEAAKGHQNVPRSIAKVKRITAVVCGNIPWSLA